MFLIFPYCIGSDLAYARIGDWADKLARGNALIRGKNPYVDGLTEGLCVECHQFFDTVRTSCSYNFILDRPVLSIVRNILAVYQTHTTQPW